MSECDSHHDDGDYFLCDYRLDALTVFVIGASGDLAKKKTYPSLYALYKSGYLPEHFTICGYARSKKSDEEFREKIRPYLPKDEPNTVTRFLCRCLYRNGGYDDYEAVKRVSDEMRTIETQYVSVANRLFYFAFRRQCRTDCCRAQEISNDSQWLGAFHR